MSIEAMKQALAIINDYPYRDDENINKAINLLGPAIAELERRKWVNLTYPEIIEEADRFNLRDGTLNGAISFANVIAAKLKAKNS
jgi:hypothetical protein